MYPWHLTWQSHGVSQHHQAVTCLVALGCGCRYIHITQTQCTDVIPCALPSPIHQRTTMTIAHPKLHSLMKTTSRCTRYSYVCSPWDSGTISPLRSTNERNKLAWHIRRCLWAMMAASMDQWWADDNCGCTACVSSPIQAICQCCRINGGLLRARAHGVVRGC